MKSDTSCRMGFALPTMRSRGWQRCGGWVRFHPVTVFRCHLDGMAWRGGVGAVRCGVVVLLYVVKAAWPPCFRPTTARYVRTK
jgi:hypothetical protein